MTKPYCSPGLRITAIFAVLGCCTAVTIDASADELSLEALYTDPGLPGSPPIIVEWSEDGANIAFVWNEDGYRNGNIWIYSSVTGKKRQLTRHDIDQSKDPTQCRCISAVQWLSPRELVYVFEGDLYSVDMDGKSTLLEAHKDFPDLLQVAPGGGALSFVSNGELWVRNANQGEGERSQRLLTSKRDRVYVESYKWSRDGSRIAFVMADNADVPDVTVHYFAQGREHVLSVARPFPGDETTRRRMGIVDVTGGDPVWLQRRDESHPIWGYGWSADGRAIFVDSSDFLVKKREILVHDTTTLQHRTYYSYHDARTAYPAWSAAWAPNDEGLVILSDHEGFYHLYHVREPGSVPVALTGGEWEVASFRVDSQDSQIHFVANKDHVADRQLYRVGLTPGERVVRISPEAGTYEPYYSPDFRHVVYRFSDDHTPPDLYYQSLSEASNAGRITESPQDKFYEFEWADVKYVEFRSHIDNTPLVGRLYLPANFDESRRYPLIVGSVYRDTVRNQWGGSQNSGGRAPHPTWGLDQFLVSKGYLVFNVDVRGSWGHGKDFRNGLDEYGSIDIDDIESGVRHLVSLGYVDPERVGIWGLSYGGLMTTMSLFSKPGFYAAGVAGAPATNVWHAYPEQMRVMGEPTGNDYPARYERQSPLFQAAGLEDPLMIIHGTKDVVVLYADSIALAEKLIADDKMFEMVTLPGAPHPWADESVELTRHAFKRMFEFFERHLK